jgi:hypothetical protein
MADELAAKLARRSQINDGAAAGDNPSSRVFNPYTEFPVRLTTIYFMSSLSCRQCHSFSS